MDEFEIDRATLLATFGEEARELLDDMERRLLALETTQGDAETLHALFRAAHTLKGGALLTGMAAVGAVTHVAEDLLERWRDGKLERSSSLVTLLLRVVDALRAGVSAGVADRPADEAGLLELGRQLGEAMAVNPPALRPSDAPFIPPSDAPAMTPSDVPDPALRGRRTLRVDVAKLDQMLDLTGELAIARGRVADLLERGDAVPPERILEAHRETDRLFTDLQELVMKARMVPIEPVFRGQQRAVRDVAGARGKSARLVVQGGDVEVDTAIVEGVKEALGHLVRNAVDHGLETPPEREAAGKDPTGTVTLRAFQEGGGIVVQVSDDGRGVDTARVAARAVELGLAADEGRAAEADLAGLLSEPGFSTADEITDISGRGVGMDVVRRKVEGLRGTLELETRAGRGTTFTLRLPLTLAIIQGFRVEVAGDVYIVPLETVAECLDLPPGDGAGQDEAEGVIQLRGQPLPFLRLRRLLRLEGPRPARECVVVVGHGTQRVGLAVDGLLGESQVVIKPLGSTLRNLPALAGSAILGDGRVALILDVPGLLRLALRRRGAEVAPAP